MAHLKNSYLTLAIKGSHVHTASLSAQFQLIAQI